MKIKRKKPNKWIIFAHILSFSFIMTASSFSQSEKISFLTQFNNAKSLEKAGKKEAAFEKYLSVPGAEYAALLVARSAPEKYLNWMKTSKAKSFTHIKKLIEGDLLLLRGEQTKALACYRSVSKMIATNEKDGWETGHIPMNYYPVDLSEEKQYQADFVWSFMIAPGSQRDNWLLRRFITLHAMDDAEKEFKRIWEIHTKSAHKTDGYDSFGLQFSLDYSSFLKQQNHLEESFSVLLKPILLMDLDLDPNLNNRIHRYRIFGCPRRVARKEFIRIVLGTFKKVGREQELIDAVEKNISSGKNRSIRVLAQIRFNQHRIDEAIALELRYIEKKKFNLFSATYRRGILYEKRQRLKKAKIEYEKFLSLDPPPSINVPHPDENFNQMMGQCFVMESPFEQGLSVPMKYKIAVLNRLKRLYLAEAETEKLLSLSLLLFDFNPKNLEQFKLIQKTRERFKVAKRDDEFKQWAINKATISKNPTIRANLYWAVGDVEKTFEALKTCKTGSELWAWKKIFRKEKKEPFKRFLILALTIDPNDSPSRLELLNLQKLPLQKEAIPLLEKLLDPHTRSPFPFGKGVYNSTQFKNYYDLAYRLMRLYEKEKQIDLLKAVGLRVALGNPPFTSLNKIDRKSYSYQTENGIGKNLSAILSLLLLYADETTLEQLTSAWNDFPDFPNKRQLERRHHGGFHFNTEKKSFKWSHLPEGIKLFASNQKAVSFAKDNQYVYVGHPWGIAVYNHTGEPVIRIALGTVVQHLEICNKKLWAGTPIGLARIDPKTWDVAYLTTSPSESKTFKNDLFSLACDGDFLWIGTQSNIGCLDTKDMSLRIFSTRELHAQNHNRWNHFIIEPHSVWIDGYYGARHYNRKTKKWSVPEYNNKPIHLSALVDGKIFGSLLAPQSLHNYPCLIDSTTLKITPILLDKNTKRKQYFYNDPACYCGTYNGNLTFGVRGQPLFIFDQASCRLKPIKGYRNIKEHLINRPNSQHYFTSKNQTVHSVSSQPFSNAILGNTVFSVVPDPKNKKIWLCTDFGLSILNNQDIVLSNLSKADGLSANHITSGVVGQSNIYFSSSWDDQSGGLIIYHPKTSTFTTRYQSDGLATDKILTPSALQKLMENKPQKPTKRKKPMPYLGGTILSERTINGKIYTCGNRGMIISKAPLTHPPAPPVFLAKVEKDKMIKQIQEAAAFQIKSPISLQQLEDFLKNKNPYIQADALLAAASSPEILRSKTFIPLVQPYITNAFLRVGTSAIYALHRSKNTKDLIPIFEQELSNTDWHIRTLATLYLCQKGKIPDTKYIRAIFEQTTRGGTIYIGVGAKCTTKVTLSRMSFTGILSPHATPKIFALILEFTTYLQSGKEKEKILDQLGASLRRQPESAQVLLHAYDKLHYKHDKRDLAATIFKYAGTNMLAVLHTALNSKDPIVRSNAARACGTIGDPSSIPHLMNAIKSGIPPSSASVVWALGELQAKEARALIENLYSETLNNEKEIRFAQSREFLTRQNDPPKSTPQKPKKNRDILITKDIFAALQKINSEKSQPFYRNLVGAKDRETQQEAIRQLSLKKENIPLLTNLLADPNWETRIIVAIRLLILEEKSAEPYILEGLKSKESWRRSCISREFSHVKNKKARAFLKQNIDTLLSNHPDKSQAIYLKELQTNLHL